MTYDNNRMFYKTILSNITGTTDIMFLTVCVQYITVN